MICTCQVTLYSSDSAQFTVERQFHFNKHVNAAAVNNFKRYIYNKFSTLICSAISNSVTKTHAATLMAGAQGCCGKGPIKSTSIRMGHGVPYFTPYMQELGGALLMSFQIFCAHVHMHRIASAHKYMFALCHLSHVCRILDLSRHLYTIPRRKPLRYFVH